jgi:hypothetical protein
MATGFQIRKIVRTGDPSPDGNGFYESIILEPVINNQGAVAFSCRRSDTELDEADNEVLCLADATGWHLLAREGDPAPNGDGVFGSPLPVAQPVFFWPAINDAGQVVSAVGYVNFQTPFSHSGMIQADVNGIDDVVRLSQPIPGDLAVFDNLYGGFDPVDANGRTAFIADTLAGGVQSGQGIWRWANGVQETILQIGDPDPAGGTIIDFLGTRPAIGKGGWTMFKAVTQEPGGQPREALYQVSPAGVVRRVLREGDPAPGGGTFEELGLISAISSLNSSGGAVFRTLLYVPPFFDTRVFRATSGGLAVAAKEGDPSPDGNGAFASFLDPQINDAGHLALVAVFEFDGPNGVDVGIIRDVGAGWEVVMRTGDLLPKGGATMSAGNVGTPQLNNAGSIASVVGIEGTEFDVALVYAPPGQPVTEILRSGDSLDGRVVTSIIIPFNNNPAGRSAINDAGEVVFAAYFTDGTQGIYVASPLGAPIPAASTWGLALLLTALTLGGAAILRRRALIPA